MQEIITGYPLIGMTIVASAVAYVMVVIRRRNGTALPHWFALLPALVIYTYAYACAGRDNVGLLVYGIAIYVCTLFFMHRKSGKGRRSP